MRKLLSKFYFWLKAMLEMNQEEIPGKIYGELQNMAKQFADKLRALVDEREAKEDNNRFIAWAGQTDSEFKIGPYAIAVRIAMKPFVKALIITIDIDGTNIPQLGFTCQVDYTVTQSRTKQTFRFDGNFAVELFDAILKYLATTEKEELRKHNPPLDLSAVAFR